MILHPVPMFLLRFFAWLSVRSRLTRLCGSLVVDSSAATRELLVGPCLQLGRRA